MDQRYDIVLYGATGVTGSKVFESFVSCGKFENFSIALAGRNERKIRELIKKVQKECFNRPEVIICDSDDDTSMAEMAKKAKLIVNLVGPFRLHGESVMKAAVENGAHQIDISGEPEWIEMMEAKYGEKARENGIYIVSACGWDSIPADFGVNLLKTHFDGDIAWIEAFLQLHFGPSGYSFSATTLHALLLSFNGTAVDGDLGATRRQIMPNRLEWTKSDHLPKRSMLWKIDEKGCSGYAMPFLGADKSIVTRTQYYDSENKNVKPIVFRPYMKFESRLNAVLLAFFMSLLKVAAKNETLKKVVMRYPSISSFNMFTEGGPSEEQMREASFTYKFFAYGYGRGDDKQSKPGKKLLVTCTGPDVGYIATSGCVLSSMLVFLRQKESLPKSGGVFTTATAFRNSRILDFLRDFGIKFEIEVPSKL